MEVFFVPVENLQLYIYIYIMSRNQSIGYYRLNSTGQPIETQVENFKNSLLIHCNQNIIFTSKIFIRKQRNQGVKILKYRQ